MLQRTIPRFGMFPRTVASVLVLTAGLAGAALAPGGATAASVSRNLRFPAIEDGYTSSTQPKRATGSAVKLVAGRLRGNSSISYLKFTVSGLPAGATVSRATLSLTRDEHHLPKVITVARVASTNWRESTLTAAGRPAVGATLATISTTSASTGITADVTKAVTGAGTYAFAVNAIATNDVARFRSAEYATGQPALTVTFTQPTGGNVAPTPTPSPSADCTVDAKLVPSCGVLWGAAAGGFSDTPRDQAMREWETKTGRAASVYHTYHRGDELFPTKAEIAMAHEAGKPRALLLNWKVAYGTSWAKVAAGGQDARIDRLAGYLKANYATDKFFLALHHEPENDIVNVAGSGFTAKDYAAMYRHTVLRLRADGVRNAVFVVAYMGIEKWFNQAWWQQLYPGDDVVDWIGLDAYVSSQPGGYHYGDFSDLVNRTKAPTIFPGFYNWQQANHKAKPLMLAEWGVHEYAADPTQKVRTLSTVLAELNRYPAIKGMFWFDTAKDQNGADIRVDSSPGSLVEVRKIAADPRFVVRIR